MSILLATIIGLAGATTPAEPVSIPRPYMEVRNDVDIQSQDTREKSKDKEEKPAPRQRWTASDFDWLETPPDQYWDKVAVCESRSNWRDRGNFAGGLGIAVTTWRNYGGRQFASSPDKATRREQIAVANRIAIFGFQTKAVFLSLDDIPHRPFFRPPSGFNGWGCIRNKQHLKPPVPGPWEQRRNK